MGNQKALLEATYGVIDKVMQRTELGMVVSEERKEEFEENVPEIFEALSCLMNNEDATVRLCVVEPTVSRALYICVEYIVDGFYSDYKASMEFLMQKGVLFDVEPAYEENDDGEQMLKVSFRFPGIWEDNPALLLRAGFAL